MLQVLDQAGPKRHRWLNDLSPSSRTALADAIREYILRDQLQDYRPYPKQAIFHAAGRTHRHRLLRAGNQNGKLFRDDTPIPTPLGWRRFDELQVGDEVYGLDGQTTKVTGVFPHPPQDMFRVAVSDGSSVLAGPEHLWMVRKARGKKGKPALWQIRRTDQMLTGTRWELPDRPVIVGRRTVLPIDPYLLGLILGDGCLTKGVTITTMDEEIRQYCEDIAPQYGCTLVKKSKKNRATDWGFRKVGRRNPLIDALRKLGLFGTNSHTKFVPELYLWASADARLALVQGMMDTDGTAGNTRSQQRSYSTVSSQLARDFRQLVQSLGMQATLKVKRGRYQGKRHLSWRVGIRCGGHSLFRLARKRWNEEMGWADARRMLIRSIEPEERAKCRCISVNAPDSMYLIGDFIPTHNTFPTSAEWAMHLTGEYPDYWRGRVFPHPGTYWATGITGDNVRDNCQRLLIGEPGRWGSGMIPARCLTDMMGKARGTVGLLDYIRVKNAFGGTSLLRFRYYAQSRETWQGPPVHGIWFDEEPPEDMYAEGIARLIATQGISAMSYTPMLGRTNVTRTYIVKKGRPADYHDTKMTIDDAQHLTDAEKAAEKEKWPEHERPARLYGEPMQGEGLIYPVTDEEITCEPFKIPEWMPVLGTLDFGWDHPTAAVRMAWDRDADIVYITHEYREQKRTAEVNCLTLKHWGEYLRWAWPHDGHQPYQKGDGIQTAKVYRREGLKMLPNHAQFPESHGDQATKLSRMSVDRGINDCLQRMQSSRLKIFKNCNKILEERRLYHRKKGLIVKEEDDLMDAMRVGIMSLRFFQPATKPPKLRRPAPNWRAN